MCLKVWFCLPLVNILEEYSIIRTGEHFFFGMNYSLLPVKDYLAVTELQDMFLSMKYQTILRNRCVWHLILLNRVFCCCQDGVEICCGFFEGASYRGGRLLGDHLSVF